MAISPVLGKLTHMYMIFFGFRAFIFIHCLQLLLPAVIVASIMSVTSGPACGGRTWCPHRFEVSSAVGIAGQGGRDSFAKGGETAFHIVPFLPHPHQQ